MHLKADTDEEKYSEYLDGYRLYELVKKYSDYIRYPIRMLRPTRRVKEGSDPEKPEYEYVDEMTTVNSMVPLWQRPQRRGDGRGVREVLPVHRPCLRQAAARHHRKRRGRRDL